MKKFLKILVWVLTIGAIITGWTFAYYRHINHPLSGLQLTLNRETEKGFIDYNAVYHDIMNICDTANNTKITMIPIDSVRNYLKTIPWATFTDANISLDEALVVQIDECQPVMRVYNEKGNSVYLDADGNIYPVSSRYVPHLIIGNGNLKFNAVTKTSSSIYDASYRNTKLPEMFKVIMSVLNNSYASCCVKQVYLAKNKLYKLTMNNVDIEVILGDSDNVDIKISNLEYFLGVMQGNPDLKNYKSLNFNFENQVVCTKNKIK